MAIAESTLSITSVMNAFELSFSSTIVHMSAIALRVLMTLATIDLLWSVLSNLDEQDHLKNLILRSMKYGFFLWVIIKYGWLLDCVIDGFYDAGLEAGGDSGTVRGYLSNPNKLIEFGLHVARENLQYSSKVAVTLTNALGTTTQSALSWHDVIAFLTISGFFIMALQVFLTYLEFYILGGLALILVPFGVFPRTAHLAEKVFTLVICFGVKLMVIAYILSIVDPLFQSFKPPGDGIANYVPSVPESIRYLSGTMVLCALMWHAPNLAAGILSGALTMNAGSTVQQMRGLTYGMTAGGGGGGQGGGNNPAMSNATKVSTFAQPAANVAGGYFADMQKIHEATDMKTKGNNPVTNDGAVVVQAGGGVGATGSGAGGATTIADRRQAPINRLDPSVASQAAATTEDKKK